MTSTWKLGILFILIFLRRPLLDLSGLLKEKELAIDYHKKVIINCELLGPEYRSGLPREVKIIQLLKILYHRPEFHHKNTGCG